MQVTKTVQNVPLLHGHGHEVVNATGRPCHRWRFAPDCPTRQSNAASDRQRLAPSPNKHGPASYPTPCSKKGSGRGCCEATDLEQWKPEPLAAVTRPSHGPCGPVGTLSCWKMKKSPEIARISGSISGFISTSRIYSPFILRPGSANMRSVKTASFSCPKTTAFAFIVLAK